MLIVAATSARMLAESARRGGLRPIALDLFGDTDTRRAGHWIGLGNSLRSGIDAERLRAVLMRLAGKPGVLGWVAGSGFEDRLGLLRDCANALPLIGNDADAVGATKRPADFFGMLDRWDIGHPEICLTSPQPGAGWLRKSVGGTGGWHVRRLGIRRHTADPGRPRRPQAIGAKAANGTGAQENSAAMNGAAVNGTLMNGQTLSRAARKRLAVNGAVYYQREDVGDPMSILFLANREDARLIGFNRMLFARIGRRPYVWQGAVGPVAVSDAVVHAVKQAVRRISREVGLSGLNSMDFLLAGARISVLEINPRPSASMVLHDGFFPSGLMAAHVAACRDRLLPPWQLPRDVPVNGYRIVYARRPLQASDATQSRLRRMGWCHDIGPPGTRTGTGEPLCSVSAQAASPAAVIAQLDERERQVQRLFEDQPDGR